MRFSILAVALMALLVNAQTRDECVQGYRDTCEQAGLTGADFDECVSNGEIGCDFAAGIEDAFQDAFYDDSGDCDEDCQAALAAVGTMAGIALFCCIFWPVCVIITIIISIWACCTNCWGCCGKKQDGQPVTVVVKQQQPGTEMTGQAMAPPAQQNQVQ